MNLIKWILNKKKIESKMNDMIDEITDQDNQYEKVLQDFTKMEGQLDLLIQRNNELEQVHSKNLETIGNLRKKCTKLNKELKELKNSN